MKEKTPLSHEAVCFQMLDFEISNSKSEVSKSNFTIKLVTCKHFVQAFDRIDYVSVVTKEFSFSFCSREVRHLVITVLYEWQSKLIG